MSLDYYLDPSDLDEFLVEYVDGTMDPVVREAFEEFMRVYPEVRSHVDCLASIRTELCKLGDDCRCHAPDGFQDRLKQQLACEMSGTAGLDQWTPQLNMIALAFSITILVLAVGLSRVSSQEEIVEAVVTASEEVSSRATAEFGHAVLLRNPGAEKSEWRVSNAHRVLMTSSISAGMELPMLMSVRREFVAATTTHPVAP